MDKSSTSTARLTASPSDSRAQSPAAASRRGGLGQLFRAHRPPSALSPGPQDSGAHG